MIPPGTAVTNREELTMGEEESLKLGKGTAFVEGHGWIEIT